MEKSFKKNPWHTPVVILIAGCLISACGFGARSVMGLYLEPMTEALSWNRETFAMAMAIQNLVWGLGMAVASKKGSFKSIARVLASVVALTE